MTTPSDARIPKAIVIRFLVGSRLGFGGNGCGGFGVSIRRAASDFLRMKLDQYHIVMPHGPGVSLESPPCWPGGACRRGLSRGRPDWGGLPRRRVLNRRSEERRVGK